MQYKVGIDLGGTKTEIIILAENNQVIFRKRIPTPRDGYFAILQSVSDLCFEGIRQIPEEDDYTIGIGIPGTIYTETKLVQNANTTCLIDKPFQQDLEKVFKKPIRMENDANCFTLAECVGGAAAGYNFVFGVIMGTGCGGGLCIDGNVRQGNHGIAGEWGHFSIDPNGLECYCGNHGCIETKISGSGVERAFRQKFGHELSMQEIVDGYRVQDPLCKEIFEQFLDDFGRSLGGVISMLDPDAVVLGGGLSNIDELYTIGIERIRHYAFHRCVNTPILRNSLSDSAGVFGAAWIGL